VLSIKAGLNKQIWPLKEIFDVHNKASFERKINEIIANAVEFKTIDLTTATESDQLQWLAEFARLDIAFDTLEAALKLATIQHEAWIDKTKLGSVMAELAQILTSATQNFITWMAQCSASAGWPAWAVQLKLEFGIDDNSQIGSFCAKNYDSVSFVDRLNQLIDASSDNKPPDGFKKRCIKMGLCSKNRIALLKQFSNSTYYHHYFSSLILNDKTDLKDIRKEECKAWSSFTFSFDQAIEIIIKSLRQLSGDLPIEIGRAVIQGRIKVSHLSEDESFCMDTPCGSFISLSFNGGLNDLALLAHECGHLIHQQAIRQKYALAQNIDEELSETIAIFFENWVVQHWGKMTGNDVIATAWQRHRDIEWQGRHTMLASFELALYQRVKVSIKDMDSIWREANRCFYGDVVGLSNHFSHQWLALTHILNAPFYFLVYPSASHKAKELMNEPISVLKLLKKTAI